MPRTTPPAPAPDPEEPPAARWFEFHGPYPVVVMHRALDVAPGDVVEWPDGAPDDVHWRPTEAPSTEES